MGLFRKEDKVEDKSDNLLDILYENETVIVNTILAIIITLGVLKLISKLKESFSNNNDSNADISTGLLREQRMTSSSSMSQLESSDKILSPSQFKPFKCVSVTKVSHNTKLLKFELPYDRDLGLPIGRHVSVRGLIDGKSVLRPYTPTSSPTQKGYFELLVKKYDLGKMSPMLHDFKVGSTLDVRGPIGRFKYQPNLYHKMGMIAAGSGLTPCLQVIRCVLESEIENTHLILFFQNRCENDILLKDEIDKLAVENPQRFEVYYYVTNPTNSNWAQGNNKVNGNIHERKGYITGSDAQKDVALLKPHKCPFIGLCGPSGFNDAAKQTLLSNAVKHTETSIHQW